jgi:DNA repair photolyase
MPAFSVREIQCKSVINRVQGMPFSWSINPYRGCRHACVYCYARPTHEYLGLNAADEFQEVIFAKVNAPSVVREELNRRSWKKEGVVIGTATDPYQQAESKYQITRGILEAFRDFSNPASLTTKSPMILRDLDILSPLAREASVTVHFTVTTMDEQLWRKIEPTTSKPRKRLEAIRKLKEHGIRAGVFLSPILPGLTDDDEHLEAVIAGAKECGADFVMGNVLRLGPGITEYYLPFLNKEFPELKSRYQELYHGKYAPAEYSDQVQARVQALKIKHSMDRDFTPPAKKAPTLPPTPQQLNLFSKQTP